MLSGFTFMYIKLVDHCPSINLHLYIYLFIYLSRDQKGCGSFSHEFGFRSVYQYREERNLYQGFAPPESEVTAYQADKQTLLHTLNCLTKKDVEKSLKSKYLTRSYKKSKLKNAYKSYFYVHVV